jgi:uncharacterized paraquat-inducible protein A
MALINCPECNAQISDKAAVCPKCGHPMREALPYNGRHPQKVPVTWMAIAVIALILILFLMLNTCKWAPVV